MSYEGDGSWCVSLPGGHSLRCPKLLESPEAGQHDSSGTSASRPGTGAMEDGHRRAGQRRGRDGHSRQPGASAKSTETRGRVEKGTQAAGPQSPSLWPRVSQQSRRRVGTEARQA